MVTRVDAAPLPLVPAAQPAAPALDPESCTILTPSGALIARGSMSLRDPSIPDEAYDFQVTNVEPRGALEALFYAGRPEVVLRAGHAAQMMFKIDHITGPPAKRTYFLQTA